MATQRPWSQPTPRAPETVLVQSTPQAPAPESVGPHRATRRSAPQWLSSARVISVGSRAARSDAPSMRSTHSAPSPPPDGHESRPAGHWSSAGLAASRRARAMRRRWGAVEGAALTLVSTKVATGVSVLELEVNAGLLIDRARPELTMPDEPPPWQVKSVWPLVRSSSHPAAVVDSVLSDGSVTRAFANVAHRVRRVALADTAAAATCTGQRRRRDRMMDRRARSRRLFACERQHRHICDVPPPYKVGLLLASTAPSPPKSIVPACETDEPERESANGATHSRVRSAGTARAARSRSCAAETGVRAATGALTRQSQSRVVSRTYTERSAGCAVDASVAAIASVARRGVCTTAAAGCQSSVPAGASPCHAPATTR